MEDRIKYSKETPINYKVIKEEDILQLAKLFDGFSVEGSSRTEYTITFDDKSRITGTNKSVFLADEFIRRKSVYIKLEYISKSFDDRIEIELYSTLKYTPDSKISITSYNKTWYDCTTNKVNTIIDEIENQKKIALIDDSFLMGALPVLLGLGVAILVVALLSSLFPQIHDEGWIFFLYLGCGIISIILFSKIMNDMVKIFPKVDFAFGPEFKNKGAIIKRTWVWVVGTLLIPIILGITNFIVTGG